MLKPERPYTEAEFEPCLFGNLNLRDNDRKDIADAKNEVRMALRDGIPRVYAGEGLNCARK